MIPIRAEPEPDELTNARSQRLAWLRLRWDAEAVDAGDPESIAAFVARHGHRIDAGYGVARHVIRRQQHRKCAYCERKVAPSDPLDHHRPRRPLRPSAGTPLTHSGYFWLTWSPGNLMQACTTCNGHKGAKYPVDNERLVPWSEPTDGEMPSWVDPLREDPTEHIAFRRDPTLGKWTIVGLTTRGRGMIRDLVFIDHDEDWQDRLQTIERLVRSIDRAVARGDAPTDAWSDTVEALLSRTEPFRALTHAWLDQRYPHAWRVEHGVELPGLGRDEPAMPRTPLWPPRPDLDALPGDLALHIRALGQKPTVEQTRDALSAFAAVGEWTVAELTRWFPQSAATLRIHLRACAEAGRLRFDGDEVSAPDGVIAGDVGAP